MDTTYRRHDTQYDLLRKILGSLSSGLSVGTPPGGLPVIEQGPNTVSQFLSAGLVDSFGRIRVSEPQTVLEAKHIDGNDPSVWSDSNAGSVEVVDEVSESRYQMTVDAYQSGTIQHQTFRRAYYQAGKSQLVEVTFNISKFTGYVNRNAISWEAGYGDGSAGVFVGGNGHSKGTGDIWFIRRRGPSTQDVVARADWSVDPLDGSGPSGLVLDVRAPQIAWFDCEWLGVGQIRCGFIIGGARVHCHTFTWNNVVVTGAGTYMPSLSLPLRYAVSSDGLGSTEDPFTISAICGSVKSEGGQENIGRDAVVLRNIGAPITLSVANQWIPLLGVRLSALTGKQAIVRPNGIDIIPISGTAAMEYALFRNPTMTATPTWGTLDVAGTVERFIDSTGGGGVVTSSNPPLATGFILTTNQTRSAVGIPINPENQLGLSVAGVPDTLILALRATGTGNVVAGSLSLRIAH